MKANRSTLSQFCQCKGQQENVSVSLVWTFMPLYFSAKMDLHVGRCRRLTFGGKSMHALEIGTIEMDTFQGALCP